MDPNAVINKNAVISKTENIKKLVILLISKRLDRRNKVLLGLFILGVIFFLFHPIKEHKRIKQGQIVGNNNKEWVELKGVKLSDIAAFNFNEKGNFGLAISSEGEVLASSNGGSSWFLAEKVPTSGDSVSSVVINGNEVLVGTMMEDSSFASIYELENKKWSVRSGDYAGITGLSNDGKWGVGGAGFIYQIANNGEFTASRLPSWAENTTLYSVSAKENNLLIVGDYGLAASSSDNGQSWSFVKVGLKTDKPYYASLIGEGFIAIGGIGTFYCSMSEQNQSIADVEEDNWCQIKGLTDRAAIFSFYQDKEKGEVFASGGSIDGSDPLILSSEDGTNWHQESVSSQYGRVVAIAKGGVGMLAATQLGYVLIRRNVDLSIKK